MASNDEATVSEESSPLIVDGDVIEAAKENIQPLAKGRRVTALSAILSTPHAQRENRLAAARNRLRINVEVALEDEDDDPLEAYSRFVYWTVENYPQGHSAESGLLELLEEATRVLRDDRGGIWRQDIRYLKLWVLYASYVEKPAIIFKFCMVNEIGTEHALLYEEFAIALERAGRRTEADKTYLLGIARRAGPVERLESKHRDFQKRMMSSTTLPAAAPAESTPSASVPTAARRAVLGEAGSSSSSSRTRTTRAPSIREQEDVFTASPPSASTPAAPRPNARLQIFVDPTGSETADAEAAPWPELGTRKSRVKENIKEVNKFAGTTLRQAGRSQRAASGSAPKMAIYRDPDPGDAASDMPPPPVPAAKKGRTASKSSITVFKDDPAVPTTPVVPSTPTFTPYRDEDALLPSVPNDAAPGSVMKEKAAGPGPARGAMSSEAEALRKDPLKNYGAGERVVELD